MQSDRRGIIARRHRVTQVLGPALAALALGTAAVPHAAAHSRSVAVRADGPTPAPDPSEDEWNCLLDLIRFICEVLDCSAAGTAFPDVPTASLARDLVLSAIQTQISAYAAKGILPNLTPDQRAAGTADTQTVIAFLKFQPEFLPKSVNGPYTSTLESILHDLQQ